MRSLVTIFRRSKAEGGMETPIKIIAEGEGEKEKREK